ncbi:hypothetical protein [Hymenobacter volaticus]|uniref:Uncharacterized protein n=1 Tax=Hymenobacter volaticus TaxID=2932254 RepID=A0ABY4GFF4_9BACT|nr:hypothetical protein [Hymenobacter volaticus]UOQ69645.1 hypothetical protein MUN86_28885 [Hymenobacter volaticus]
MTKLPAVHLTAGPGQNLFTTWPTVEMRLFRQGAHLLLSSNLPHNHGWDYAY